MPSTGELPAPKSPYGKRVLKKSYFNLSNPVNKHDQDIIARYPNIQTLRMLDEIDTFREREIKPTRTAASIQRMTNAAAAWTQEWAQNVIQHLTERGSNIKVFAMSQYKVRGELLLTHNLFIDANDQMYPRYTYGAEVDCERYADLVLQPGEELPPLWYKAVPIRDVKIERPEQKILFHQFEGWPLMRWEDSSTVDLFP